VYQVLFVYKTLLEIVEELMSFDWDQLDGFDQLQEIDPEYKCIKYKINLLLTVAGLDHKDDKYDVTLHGKNVLPIPRMKEDVKLCDEIKEKVQRGFEIFSGRGRKLLDDRMYVRDKLEETMNNDNINMVLKECILYAPAYILEGLELVDAPGAGTCCPLEQVSFFPLYIHIYIYSYIYIYIYIYIHI